MLNPSPSPKGGEVGTPPQLIAARRLYASSPDIFIALSLFSLLSLSSSSYRLLSVSFISALFLLSPPISLLLHLRPLPLLPVLLVIVGSGGLILLSHRRCHSHKC
ncbi:hypothetical protein Hanom_Chr14g01321791 [Helianthus anomalus]